MKKPPELIIEGDAGITPASRGDFDQWIEDNFPNFSILGSIPDDLHLNAVRRLFIELMDSQKQLDFANRSLKQMSGKAGQFVPDGQETNFQQIAQVTDKTNGTQYRLGVLLPGNIPAAVSLTTGRVFFISWETICKLAIAEGIDQRESRMIIPA